MDSSQQWPPDTHRWQHHNAHDHSLLCRQEMLYNMLL